MLNTASANSSRFSFLSPSTNVKGPPPICAGDGPSDILQNKSSPPLAFRYNPFTQGQLVIFSIRVCPQGLADVAYASRKALPLLLQRDSAISLRSVHRIILRLLHRRHSTVTYILQAATENSNLLYRMVHLLGTLQQRRIRLEGANEGWSCHSECV